MTVLFAYKFWPKISAIGGLQAYYSKSGTIKSNSQIATEAFPGGNPDHIGYSRLLWYKISNLGWFKTLECILQWSFNVSSVSWYTWIVNTSKM